MSIFVCFFFFFGGGGLIKLWFVHYAQQNLHMHFLNTSVQCYKLIPHSIRSCLHINVVSTCDAFNREHPVNYGKRKIFLLKHATHTYFQSNICHDICFKFCIFFKSSIFSQVSDLVNCLLVK